ncbi:C-terminal domain of homeodomain 1-domain-containing protein [Armillaria luteobubalina]|uniref:C-terminal domain of homeodomain 1-domain-containing protein n=1 Tax=Armillaria luteobubalina TaxID=153913 RepID=A0AA39UVW4_9AGAR|nr:C-terminal domain of homeodomain 1-domain-containing protein [Armillaria luteobubalina]
MAVLSAVDSGDMHERFLLAMQDFFTATGVESSSLPEFTEQWEGLYGDFSHTQADGNLDKATAELAYCVADTVGAVCDALLELDVSEGLYCKQYEERLSNITAQQISSSTQQTPYDISKDRCAYVEPAYRWLVNNLHNPYPSREVRHKICRETGTAHKDLDNWFTNARRRIGWNTLLKVSFNHNRDRLVEAATAYFFGEDENEYHPISIAFSDMKATLTDLYSGKFEQSTLGRKLGGVVKNMTPELQAQEQANKKRREEQREAEKRAKKARKEKEREVNARRAYPSPERSPGHSADPSLPSEATSSRKRRSSDDDEDADSDTRRPKKRSRTDDTDPAVASLPSPSPSDTEDSGSSRDSTPIPSSSKRKRRLSDSDGAGTFKRHRGIHGSHRSVSDPSSSTGTKTEYRPVELYVPPNIERWFETALTEFPPDPEVDVFNYSALSSSSQYSDETESSVGPSTLRSNTPVESSTDGIAPSVTLLNNGSILDSISTPEFSVSGLDLEGLMPTAVPAEKQPEATHLSDLDEFLETFAFTGNNLFSTSTDFADVDFSSSSSSTWKLAEDWLLPP